MRNFFPGHQFSCAIDKNNKIIFIMGNHEQDVFLNKNAAKYFLDKRSVDIVTSAA